MATIEIPDLDGTYAANAAPFPFPPELLDREMLLTMYDDSRDGSDRGTPITLNIVVRDTRVYITLGPEGGDDPGIMLEFYEGNLQTFSWDGEQLGDDGTKRILVKIPE